MSTATDIDLDALIDRLLERAAERAGPVLNVNGEDISTLAAAGRVTVNPGDIVASQWGNLVYGQSVTVYASVADRNNQWPAPPDGAVCYTQAEASAWLRRAGQWLPIGSSGQLPLTSGAPFTTATDAGGELWVAKGGVNGGAWKRARDVLHLFYHRTAALTFPTASTTIAMDTMDFDAYGLYNNSTGIMTVPIGGWWLAHIRWAATATATAQWAFAGFNNAGAAISQSYGWASSAGSVMAESTHGGHFNAGDQIQTRGASSVALNAAVGAPSNNVFDAHYLGTG